MPETRTRAARPRARKTEEAKETNPLEVPFFDALGERNGEVTLPEAIFAEEPNMPVMHQAYLRQLDFSVALAQSVEEGSRQWIVLRLRLFRLPGARPCGRGH